MDVVRFERKDFSVAKSASILWASIQKNKRLGDEISRQQCIGYSGLPDHQVDAAIVYLAGATNGELREVDGELRIRLPAQKIPPWAIRLPSSIAKLVAKIQRFFAPHVPSIMGGVLVYPIGFALLIYGAWMFSSVPPDGALQVLVTAGAILGLTLGSIITIPFIIFMFAFAAPITAIVGVVELLLQGHFLVAALMAIGGAIYTFIYFHLFPLAMAFNRFGFRVSRYFLSGFLNWGIERRGPLMDEVAFIEFLKRKSGRITRWDLMYEYGWTEREAFEELTRLMVDYGGDVEVDEEGRIEFQFSRYFGETAASRERANRPSSPKLVFKQAFRAELLTWLGWLLLSAPIIGLAAAGQTVGWMWIFVAFWPAIALARRGYVYRMESKFKRLNHRFEWLDRVEKGEVEVSIEDVDAKTFADLGLDFDEETMSVTHFETVGR